MEEKRKCPMCKKLTLEKQEMNAAEESGSSNGKYPKEENTAIYICHNCEDVFLEEDLSNLRN